MVIILLLSSLNDHFLFLIMGQSRRATSLKQPVAELWVSLNDLFEYVDCARTRLVLLALDSLFLVVGCTSSN